MSFRLAWSIDLVQRILYPHRLLPPLSMRKTVGEPLWDLHGRQFELTGRHFEAKLTKDAILRPESRVLDVGSGCGRIAIPLTEIIGPSGCYFGLEAVKVMVEWCQREITPRFPHFRFFHCDVRNKAYNPRGRDKPETYQFPFDADQFDLVIATSLFTHLPPAATRNYITQCARVLKAGARLFGTFFLVDNGTRSADGKLDFSHILDGVALTTNPSVPEEAVAYRSDWLLEAFRRSKLELLPPVRWGGWAGKEPGYSWQDVLVLQKQEQMNRSGH